MSIIESSQKRPRILVVGGGYVGLYVAMNLQKKVKSHGGIVTVVDPNPYMTYQPFLPEVAGGQIEPRHVVVSHRQHLKHSELINGRVLSIDHASKKAVIAPVNGEEYEIEYTDVVMSAGAVTRTFPITGLAEQGIGLKTIEEAIALRNKVAERIESASNMTDPAERKRALTFVVVGGGFAGIETIAELEDMARHLVSLNDRVQQSEVRFVLVEAMGRIMPEVTAEQAEWVVEHLRSRGVEVLLNTSLADATDGYLQLINMADKSPADAFYSDTLIWCAGVMANPMVRSTDFPIEQRGRIETRTDLRIKDANGDALDGAWAAGDVSAVKDVTGGLPDGTCVPNAQHAVRQAKLLAKNLYAARYGVGRIKEYKHKNLGAVAGFGKNKGVAKVVGIKLKGWPAWMAHRGYHGMAMPTFERKFRVLGDWMVAWFFTRDALQLNNLDAPRTAFEETAKPKK
ncbi:NAD(P)/FAD-dependent oxidoreductase [Glutamicibacter protophormiae]|uniref:NADH dehydrogenase n=1 Tax=Glutamicibacter protophormiae TaxID=37930 RepID=A0ABS4XQJ8_GLUPR|nr:FAD-dependent oxidoreductase [Glutamicibacter protophormiae]MBP2398655.1 NADH dehydrogenase [Glutamicibacter protophormiae]QRQ79382.1 FAD-dependent oxidoreductase [Glutamicibacter protophormiae]WPR65486.1 FAD-dependent oxidoreductase [Glutamicibacter protophormiae]WPR68984.1 FAD-dependent oxidoreductase [Glutamicibacter protophormiae]GGL81367.1 NADH dehydrogenase [Glutamicibacter protophormiae]